MCQGHVLSYKVYTKSFVWRTYRKFIFRTDNLKAVIKKKKMLLYILLSLK